jgi:S-adenosylmethionine:tRNA ribosyltransferase-isomerase
MEGGDVVAALLGLELPPELSAKEPPERRGLLRDQVRLLVVKRLTGEVIHSRFDRLSDFLIPGDLLVFNSSRTIPASLTGWVASDDLRVEVRLAEHLADDSWLALPLFRAGDQSRPCLRAGSMIDFGRGLHAEVEGSDSTNSRLYKMRFSTGGTELLDLIYRLGKPIRYEYAAAPWDLDFYQNVYSKEPGSAEMPSAGRAFTWKTLLRLGRQGIRIAYLTLHTGLSSYMDDELDRKHPASEEEYFVSDQTAEKVRSAHQTGGRVIAVGTTVVRALESAAEECGHVQPGHRYTRLTIKSGYPLRVTDGLLTGLHEPSASHLDLLSAFLSPKRIRKAYEEAIRLRYLWHEFGDLNLIA